MTLRLTLLCALALAGCGSRAVTVEDADGDGFAGPADCDDADPDVHPGATEVCGGADEDCDGLIDGDDPDVDAPDVGWVDQDGDGYGAGDPLPDCDASLAAVDGDCDDADPDTHPGAPETCGPGDEDCDGRVNEDDTSLVADAGYEDADGDGYGVGEVIVGCDVAHVLGDCDDDDPAVHPGAGETCAPGDDDCDGFVDLADADLVPPYTGYADLDGDGYGADPFVRSCEDLGLIPIEGDCDDEDPAVNPDAVELCAAGDEDCDGLVGTDDPDLVDASAGYVDDDGDGYGAGAWTVTCDDLPLASVDGDCQDDDPAVNPAALEVCADGIDNDCDFAVDDVANPAAWVDLWEDGDGDGFGDLPVRACAMDGLTWRDGDCDDADAGIHPDATDDCDDVDTDCDGVVDDDASCTLPRVEDLDVAVLLGESAGDHAGAYLAFPGDVDGDGVPDVAVGSLENGGEAGAVYVVSGPVPTGTTLLEDAQGIVRGAPGDRLGGVHPAGDLDGDGRSDLWVTAGSAAGAYGDGGEAWLFHGPITGELSRPAASARLLGRRYDAQILPWGGLSVGDLDGDLVPDVVLGAKGWDRDEVYLLRGPVVGDVVIPDDAELLVRADYHEWVSQPQIVSDLDGDGRPDLLVTAAHGLYYGSTAAMIGHNTTSLDMWDLPYAAWGGLEDGVGTNPVIVGDTNGDGHPDMVVGARHEVAYLLLGPFISGDVSVETVAWPRSWVVPAAGSDTPTPAAITTATASRTCSSPGRSRAAA